MNPHENDQVMGRLAAAGQTLIGSRSIGDLDLALVQIVTAAVETVPGADAGGISFIDKGPLESRAPFNDTVLRLDELQAELGEGPCISALTDPPLGGVVVIDDLRGAHADRWPSFAARAEVYGYRSMCSTQLSSDSGPRAALNLYAMGPDAFGARSQTIAGLFGVQAALLLHGALHAAHLQTALGRRDEIGQAKGILMERYGLDATQAFRMLVSASQNMNVKLVTVARELIAEPRAARSRPIDG